jgi:hypothetical protein
MIINLDTGITASGSGDYTAYEETDLIPIKNKLK